jgi:trimeric autotransporter adhesin
LDKEDFFMPVATGDAFRYITTQGNNVGENDATLIAPDVNGTLTVVGGFGITLTADAANRKITITNTGNGTGALSTITAQNSAGTYYPVFVTAPGTYNPATGTYTSSTLYYENTTTPLTYNPGTGTLTTNALVANSSFTFNGITATSATGTGSSLVFSQSPTLSGTTTLNAALVGPSASANFTRFPNAQTVISNTASGIQQNESHNIGLIAEGVANNGNSAIYGIGVYGVGYTSATTRSGGVVGESHVSASTDVGSAIGVRGYSQDVHSGGINVGLYGNASGSTQNNYALYMAGGDIYSTVAQTWTMNGNLTFSGAYTITIPSLTATNTITGSVSGNAGTVTNGVYTTDSYSDPTWLTISKSKVGLSNVENTALSTWPGTANITTVGTITSGTWHGATIDNSYLTNSSFNIGTTSISLGRASASQSLTGVNIDGNAGTVTNGFYTTSSFNLGTTSIAVNRASGAQSLTGVSIDGSAGSVAAGNITGTTLASGVTSSSLTSFGTTPAMTSPAITTSLTTPSTSFALVNTTATTVQFAGAASTALTMGNASGTTTINGNIVLGSSGTSTIRANVGTGTPTNTATPTGYMIINVNGTNRYVPYYT